MRSKKLAILKRLAVVASSIAIIPLLHTRELASERCTVLGQPCCCCSSSEAPSGWKFLCQIKAVSFQLGHASVLAQPRCSTECLCALVLQSKLRNSLVSVVVSTHSDWSICP